MRISDWSSDVCSSDLFAILARVRRRRGALHNQLAMSDNREESFSLLEDIIVADSQLVPKNVAVTPGVRVAHLSCSEFLAGQNITVVVLRQTKDRKSTRLNSSH